MTASSDRFRRRILEHLADRRYRPSRVQDLAQELGVSAEELDEFQHSVQRMIDEGRLLLGLTREVGLPPPGREVTGTIRLAARGFGFVSPESPIEHGDLFVPGHMTGGALTGDKVRARVIREPERQFQPGRSPYIGRVVEILQRASNRFAGNLGKRGSQWVVEVDGEVFRDPVIIRDPHAKGAKAGDKVVVELIEFPREGRPAQGVITEVLGEQGEPDVETRAVMRAYGLPEDFPATVVETARRAALAFDEAALPADREDLTRQLTLTIDPPDARDYDDAISIRRLGPPQHDAVWELGIHIADVSHFVKAGDALDQEASRRGNSTYLPRRVVPMLPEVLSNGVCSLQEGVHRFCLSAFVRYDREGRVVAERYARSVIRSAKRLTYLEAQALIDDDFREAVKHARAEPKYPRPLIDALKLMHELAQVIRRRRFADGMIVLDLPEVELAFDESGRVIDAQPQDDAFTHKLIEMFMVEANEAVARLFHRLKVPMIRRIHPDPPSHDMEELRLFARAAGFLLPAKPGRRDLQKLLEDSRGKPGHQALHLALLRTLARAEYSPEPIGHFALASEHYTHFTSPIRRYADLVVHRALGVYLDALGKAPAAGAPRGLRQDPRLPSEESLFDIGRHCSTTERNSEAAEDDLRTFLVLDLLRSHLGEDYDGTVTGVTSDGIFVQLDKYLVDGFVRLVDLPGAAQDRWRINRQNGSLVAMRSGNAIRIGDRFVVRIANVMPERRKLEMVVLTRHGKKVKERRPNLPEGLRQRRDEAQRLKRDRRQQRRRRGRPR